VAQVVDARPAASEFPQTGTHHQPQECFPDCGIQERLRVAGYEHSLGKDWPSSALGQVSVQRSLGRLVQWNKAALAVLGFADEETIIADIGAFK
jgi:hypothetical protein